MRISVEELAAKLKEESKKIEIEEENNAETELKDNAASKKKRGNNRSNSINRYNKNRNIKKEEPKPKEKEKVKRISNEERIANIKKAMENLEDRDIYESEIDKIIKKKKGLDSTHIILLGFLIAILVGTFLLMLPIATAEGKSTGFTEALFTATTSTCVTGLVVVDTFAQWSLFGQIVILILIQLGGLGIVTLTSMILLMLFRKVNLKNRMLIHDAFNLDTLEGLVNFIKSVLIGTFAIEGTGALLYMFRFVPQFGARGVYISVFTAISAFCNAGIDIIGNNSLMNYATDPLIMFVTMGLIILGGIGFIVWFDFVNSIKVAKRNGSLSGIFRRLNEHTRLVLWITAILIFGGAFIIFVLEYNNPNTIGNMSIGDKALASLFQSVTLRTAGFAAIDQAAFTDACYPMFIMLMLIGGSPVGTAGGIKTVTFAVAFFNIMSYVKDRDETVIFKRKISKALISKAMAVIAVAIFAILILTTLLLATNKVSLQDALYEVTSAIATVGLSRNMTANLNTAGRFIIILSMYLGRVGPISMAVAFKGKEGVKKGVKFADGRFIVG